MALSGEKKRLANKRAYARRKLRRELSRPCESRSRGGRRRRCGFPLGDSRASRSSWNPGKWIFFAGRSGLGALGSALACLRKLGKTSLIAIVLLAFLVTTGPLFRARFRGLVDQSGWWPGSGAEATRRRDHRGKRYRGRVEIKRSPAPGRIVGLTGDVDILNADVSSGHAAGADVCVIDEAGLLEERHRPLWDAVNSARSGRDGRLIALGVRATGPMFSELLARGAAGDPNVFAVDYSAPEDCDLNNESAMAQGESWIGFD